MDLKDMVTEEMERMLKEMGVDYMQYSSPYFDFAIKTSELMFVKAFGNVDSMRREQAKGMKRISVSTGTRVLAVGMKTTSEDLEEGKVYERYGIGVVDLQTFSSILEGRMPKVMRRRGGCYKVISPEKLRKKRIEKGLTQEALAELLGISKKTVYIHERERKPAPLELVQAMEKILGDITDDVEIKPEEGRKGRFYVGAGLFDMVFMEDQRVFVKETNDPRLARYLVAFSQRLKEKALLVSDVKFPWPSIGKYELDKMSPEEIKERVLGE